MSVNRVTRTRFAIGGAFCGRLVSVAGFGRPGAGYAEKSLERADHKRAARAVR